MFTLLVDPGCGFSDIELKNLDIEILPYLATFGGEDTYKVDNSWSQLSEERIFRYFKEGKLSQFSRPPLGEWRELIERLLKRKQDVLYVAFSQKVTNSISSIYLINKLLEREPFKVHPIDTHIIDNREILKEIVKMRDNNSSIDEVKFFIQNNYLRYRNFWFPENLDIFKHTCRGDSSSEEKRVYNILYCDEEGIFRVYDKKFENRREAISYILRENKISSISVSSTSDLDIEDLIYIKDLCEDLHLFCSYNEFTPLCSITLGSNSLGITLIV